VPGGTFGDAPPVMRVRLPRPPDGALHALARILAADRVLRAFVERHQDIAAVSQLHIHRGFRSKRVQIAVQMRPEYHAVIGDFPHPAQAEDLEAARIREDGVGPRHEAVQPTQPADGLMPRAQIQMVGVGQQDLHAEIVGEVALAEPLTVAWVPTGMKTGVSMVPCGVWRRPARARV